MLEIPNEKVRIQSIECLMEIGLDEWELEEVKFLAE
jgi:hypothetical protein